MKDLKHIQSLDVYSQSRTESKNNFIPTVDKLEVGEYYKNIIDGDIIYVIERHDGDVSQYEYSSLIHGYCMDLVDCFKNKYINYQPTKEEESNIRGQF